MTGGCARASARAEATTPRKCRVSSWQPRSRQQVYLNSTLSARFFSPDPRVQRFPSVPFQRTDVDRHLILQYLGEENVLTPRTPRPR